MRRQAYWRPPLYKAASVCKLTSLLFSKSAWQFGEMLSIVFETDENSLQNVIIDEVDLFIVKYAIVCQSKNK